jgi:hypothetical protein
VGFVRRRQANLRNPEARLTLVRGYRASDLAG